MKNQTGIKKGNFVKLDYEGRLESGEVFDSSKREGHSHPLEFVAGSGMVIKGFDSAILDMKKDEEKEFTIEPKDAYGAYNKEFKKDFPRNILPKDQVPKVGMIMVLNTPDGHEFPAKIIEVDDKKIVIDLNHPLAGKKLIFKIKILEIQDKAPADFGQSDCHECSCNEEGCGCEDEDCECDNDCGDDCKCK